MSGESRVVGSFPLSSFGFDIRDLICVIVWPLSVCFTDDWEDQVGKNRCGHRRRFHGPQGCTECNGDSPLSPQTRKDLSTYDFIFHKVGSWLVHSHVHCLTLDMHIQAWISPVGVSLVYSLNWQPVTLLLFLPSVAQWPQAWLSHSSHYNCIPFIFWTITNANLQHFVSWIPHQGHPSFWLVSKENHLQPYRSAINQHLS